MRKKTKFNGSVLQQDVFTTCYYALRTYPFLKQVQKGLEEIDGLHRGFVDKVHEKVDLEATLQTMNEAFEEVPDLYIDAVKYCLFTNDSKAVQKNKVEYDYQVDYVETMIWLEKLVYQYAVKAGWPVPQRVEKITLIIYEDGGVELQ